MNREQHIVESFSFEAASSGQLLRCVAKPRDAEPRGTVLLLPPFAEELNKTRRMCALMARRLAADGWQVVRIDPFGCGDSCGEFRDASWDQWVADLSDQAAQCSSPLWLWCVRAGALFAPELLARRNVAGLLLWQPALSGSLYMQQFLRIHDAGRWLAGESDPGTPAEPRSAVQRLERGETIEVAGYELTPHMVQSFRAASFALPDTRGTPVAWFEVSPTDNAQPTPAARSKAEDLRRAGYEVRLDALSGAPFWQSTEITENGSLLERSSASVAACVTS
jgi:uncharacterized protein